MWIAVVGQGGHDFIEPELHVRESLRQRSTGPKGIVTSKNAFDVLLALVIAVVVETESFTAKGRGAAEKPIWLAMVAGRVRHRHLQNSG